MQTVLHAPFSTGQLCRSYSVPIRRPSGFDPACKKRRVFVVRAEQNLSPTPRPPQGVTQPPLSPELPPSKFGFVDSAERTNSRAAMIGFFALIAVEFILGKGFLEAIGLRVGQGLPFEI